MGKPQMLVLLVFYPTNSIEIVILHNLHSCIYIYTFFQTRSIKSFPNTKSPFNYPSIFIVLQSIETVKKTKNSVILVNVYHLFDEVSWWCELRLLLNRKRKKTRRVQPWANSFFLFCVVPFVRKSRIYFTIASAIGYVKQYRYYYFR
jgi:hypothetical protein